MQEAFSRTERESSVAVFLSTRKEYCPFLCFPHSSINAGVPFLPHLVTRSHLIYFQQLGIGTWPLNSHFHNVWRWWHCSRLLQLPLQQHTPPHLLRERIVSIFSENYFTCYTGSNIKLWFPGPDRDKTSSISRYQVLTQTACCEIVCPASSPEKYFWELIGALTWRRVTDQQSPICHPLSALAAQFAGLLKQQLPGLSWCL